MDSLDLLGGAVPSLQHFSIIFLNTSKQLVLKLVNIFTNLLKIWFLSRVLKIGQRCCAEEYTTEYPVSLPPICFLEMRFCGTWQLCRFSLPALGGFPSLGGPYSLYKRTSSGQRDLIPWPPW